MEYTTNLGVNVGTGLMLESILSNRDDRIDNTREIPNKVNLKDYKHYLMNIHSLVINILTSYDKETLDQLVSGNQVIYKKIYGKVIDETIIIKQLLEGINLIYYVIDYPRYSEFITPVNKDTKGGKLSVIADKMISSMENEKEIIVTRSKHYIPGLTTKDKCLISTSNTLDLLNASKVDIELLEFHTGVLKKRNRFHTKLKEKIDLPFSEIILLSIGDKKGIVKSNLSTKERKKWIEDLVARGLKPFNNYSRDYIVGATKDNDIVAKLKKIPNLY